MGKKSKASKLFSRAYNKAANIPPGGKNTLAKEEEAALRKALYRNSTTATTPCTVCGHPTADRQRTKPFVLRSDARICGPCCYGKKNFWSKV